MDILKEFAFGDKHHNISILWKCDEPYFRADEVACVLEIKNIHSTISKFDKDEKVLHSTETLGGVQKMTFLSELGLYKILFISRKKIADHFKKWVANVIKQIRKTGKYEIESLRSECEKYKSDYVQLKDDSERTRNISVHKALVETFRKTTKHFVYIGKASDEEGNLRDIDGKHLVKIGRTSNIRNRMSNIQNDYGNILLVTYAECDSDTQFETFMHKHKDISKHRFNDNIHPGIESKSFETFLMTADELDHTIHILKNNAHKFTFPDGHKNTTCEQIEEFHKSNIMKEYAERMMTETRKTMVEMWNENREHLQEIKKDIQEGIKPLIKDQFSKLQSNVRYVSNTSCVEEQYQPEKYVQPTVVVEDEHKEEIEDETEPIQGKISCQVPYVQMYSEDGKTLLKVYDGYTNVSRDKELDYPPIKAIQRAIKDNSLLKGYRWAVLDRSEESGVIQNLAPTQKTKGICYDLIAILDKRETQIIKVFSSQEQVADYFDLKSGAAISVAIKKNTPSQGHYIRKWEDCDQKLKEDYLRENELPSKRSTNNSVSILEIDPSTNETKKRYNSYAEAVRMTGISRRKLKTVIENNEFYKGSYWRLG